MDVRRLLKVYNYVNDERRARVNVKFAATAAAAFVLVIAGLAYLADHSGPAVGCPPECTETQSRSDYVGLDASELSATSDPTALAEERLEAWKAAHPDYVVLSVEPVKESGVTIGFNVVYRLAAS